MRYYERPWPEGLSLIVYTAADLPTLDVNGQLTRTSATRFASDSGVALSLVQLESGVERRDAEEIEAFPTTRLLLGQRELARTRQTFFTWVQLEHWVRDQLRDNPE
jgi:hypothetical protein